MSSEEFLYLLGTNPAETFCRTIAPKNGCNRSRAGRDLHGLNITDLQSDNQAGSSVYFVTGDAEPPLSGKLSPLDLKTRGLEDMTNASLQRSRQS
jgi:hypothetical protein